MQEEIRMGREEVTRMRSSSRRGKLRAVCRQHLWRNDEKRRRWGE